MDSKTGVRRVGSLQGGGPEPQDRPLYRRTCVPSSRVINSEIDEESDGRRMNGVVQNLKLLQIIDLDLANSLLFNTFNNLTG